MGVAQLPLPFQKIVQGQISLIVCCLLYIVWWVIAFHPHATRMNKIQGNIPLLFVWVTAGLGLDYASGGLYAICQDGMGTLVMSPIVASIATSMVVVLLIAGVFVYALMLFGSVKILKRKLTSELLFLTLWAVLELIIVEVVEIAQTGMTTISMFPSVMVIAIASCVGLGCYLVYYKLAPWPAFYLAMVPLAVNALAMAFVTCQICGYF